jgi:hypothetical protein
MQSVPLPAANEVKDDRKRDSNRKRDKTARGIQTCKHKRTDVDEETGKETPDKEMSRYGYGSKQHREGRGLDDGAQWPGGR